MAGRAASDPTGYTREVRWTVRLIRVMPLALVLVAAVAVMHSLPTGGEHGGSTTAATRHHMMSCCPDADGTDVVMSDATGGVPMPGHGPDGWAHLCLAVLTALLIGLAVGSFRRRLGEPDEDAARNGPAAAQTLPLPPRLAGRTLLNSLCVLRV